MRTLPSYAVALLVGLLLLAWPAPSPAAPVPGLAWTAPARVRLAPWPADRAAGEATTAGDRAVEVGPAEVLLVDARAGDVVAVTGVARAEDLELGLVLEARGRPASIAWIESTARPGGREVTVPLWSDATAIAARPRERTRLTARVAEPEIQTMTWERFEDDAVTWIEGGRPAPPSPPSPVMEASLRRIEALREALGPAARTTAGQAWLALLLVEAGFVHRPLLAMSYPTAWLKLGGEAPTPADRALYADLSTPVQWPGRVEWRRVAGGGELPVVAAGADAVQLTLFAAAESPARVVVRAGGLPVHVFALPGRHDAPVTPGHARVILPIAQRAVSLQVEGGSVLVGVTAFWNRVGIGDTFTRRRDRAHLAAVAGGPAAGPMLRALAAAWREPGPVAFQDLVAADASDLAPGPRAALLWATARLAPSTAAAVEAVVAAWKATAALAPRVAVPVRRALVEALLERRLDPDEAPQPGSPFAGLARLAPLAPLATDGNDDDVAAIRAALAALDPLRDGRRPAMADEASRYALGHGLLPDAKARARRAWTAESAWRALAPVRPAEALLRWVTPAYREGLPAGRCAPEGPSGHRWVRLAGGAASLDVQPPAGATHVAGSFRAETRDRLGSGALTLDGVPVPVHSELGLPSRVALAAGPHRVALAPGAPAVLALFPRADPLPCESLRDLERWYRVDDALPWRIPAGDTETALRITVRREREGPPAESVTIDAAGVRAEVTLVAGEEASVEVPWRRGGSSVRVGVSSPVLVRVSARLRRLPASAAAPAGTGIVDEDAAVARVRALSHGLRTIRGDATQALRERAALLQRLGFARLAGSDRARAEEAEEVARSDDDGAEGDEPAQPRALPPRAGPVVPLNVAARVPVLASAPAGAISDRDVARMEAGDFAAVVDHLAGATRPPRADESTLLLALSASRAQRWEVAASAYERLALEGGSPAAAVEAASALADLALSRRDPDLALRGYLFARKGDLAGADARAARARLDPAVRFEHAADAVALGYAWVQRRGGDARSASSLAARVRRAFLDAPADAIVLTEGERAVAVLSSSRRVLVETECSPLLTTGEARSSVCRPLVEVDGSARPCDGARGCTLDLAPGPHRIEVTLLALAELTGWVRLRDHGSGAALPLDSAARWFEIDAAHPLAVAFAGPTLVRVAGRGGPEGGGRVAVLVDGLAAGELDLALPTDAEASRRGVKSPPLRALDEPQVVELVVLAPGPHVLRVVADRRTLVLPSVAGPHGLPRPQAAPPPRSPAAEAGLLLPAWSRAPEVGEDPSPGPFTLSTHAHAVMGYLGDPAVPREVSADYLELDVQLRRRLFGDLAYVRAGALVRPRISASTFGLAGRIDVNGPLGLVPRAFVEGEIYAQKLTSLGVSAKLHSGLWWQVMPTSILAFVPTVGLDIRRVVAPPADDSQVHDPDVYLLPSSIHPRIVFLSLLTSLRPTIDTFLRLRTGVHLNDFASVNNVYVTPSFDVAPGRGLWPLLSVGYTGTHTFAGSITPVAYDTHVLTLQGFFWHWLLKGHRISIDSTLQISLAGPDQSQLIFGVGYDYTGRRGVNDFGPLEMDFRERFDEDGGRVIRRQRGVSEIPAEPVSP